MTRAEAATALCRRLSADVEAIASPGLGAWAETWEIVADADATFVLALAGWEQTGAESDRVKVRDCYDRVLDAWRRAAEQYRREGVSQ